MAGSAKARRPHMPWISACNACAIASAGSSFAAASDVSSAPGQPLACRSIALSMSRRASSDEVVTVLPRESCIEVSSRRFRRAFDDDAKAAQVAVRQSHKKRRRSARARALAISYLMYLLNERLRTPRPRVLGSRCRIAPEHLERRKSAESTTTAPARGVRCLLAYPCSKQNGPAHHMQPSVYLPSLSVEAQLARP